MASVRNERIAEQVRSELSRLLREETSDPRIGILTLTRVKVSPDLSQATVFWSPLELETDLDPEEVGRGLASAAGFLRTRLASELALRRTPALSFRHDRSIEEGSRTLALLRSLPEFSDDSSEGGSPEASADASERNKSHGQKG